MMNAECRVMNDKLGRARRWNREAGGWLPPLRGVEDHMRVRWGARKAGSRHSPTAPSPNVSAGMPKGKTAGMPEHEKSDPFSSLAVWGVRASRLRCPVCASPTSGSLPTDRCTRLCSACSAAGSAEQRGHTGGPRRLFGYFLAGEKASCPLCTSFAAEDRFCRCAKSIHKCGGVLDPL